ncbi:MAG: amidohydrolase family protein, partial [Nitrososphaerota archaeon]
MLSNVLGFINGNIYVSFIPLRKASGIVVCAERILYVGEKEKAERLATMLNGSIIDLNGLTVMPGFIDSHMHVDDLAVSLHSINLRSVHSIKTLKQYLKNYYEKNKEVSWIVGRGWDQELFEEKRWPSRYDIDD